MTERDSDELGQDEAAHALVAQYFDGELAPEREAEALAHLASCPACQRELGDLIGLHVALERGAASQDGEGSAAVHVAEPLPARPAPADSDDELSRRRARRRRVLAGALVLAAAAAAAVWIVRKPDTAVPQLALANTRGMEPRFSAEPFARHRPYSVVRGAAAREDLSLDTLAKLERAGQRDVLAAALAATGELDRARAQLVQAPASPRRDADLAALELLAGAPEAALEAAARALEEDPQLVPAHWNRALAARALGLPLLAADAFERVARAAEPGWAQEATAHARALREPAAKRQPEYQDFVRRAHAMIDRSGPPLTERDVAARPGLTRIYFYDALRGATDADEARALAPLAEALDDAVGNGNTRKELERVAGADFRVRAPLARRYRDIATLRATERAAELLGEVDRLGPPFDDLRLALIGFAGQRLARRAQVDRLLANGDPWFELVRPADRAKALIADGYDDRAESALLEALATCDDRRWGHRCASLAIELGKLYTVHGRNVEAEQAFARAHRVYRAIGAVAAEDAIVATLAEVRRGLGRTALAEAMFREAIQLLTETNCVQARYAVFGLAIISVYQRGTLDDVDLAADACGVPPELPELAVVIDFALMHQRPEDLARARTWIAAARASGDERSAVIAELAEARLSAGEDPTAETRVHAALAKVSDQNDVERGFRAWAYQTLIDLAARRDEWPQVAELAAAELGAAAPRECALVISRDDTRGVAVALGPSGAAVGTRRVVEVPAAFSVEALVNDRVRAALAGCPRIAVFARPPLHGRADLLPPEVPWHFVGTAAAAASTPAANSQALFVGDARPPTASGLPALAPMRAPPDAVVLRESQATPSRVLAELGRAGYAELHVHGQVDLEVADASFLALSPDVDASWALTSAMVRKAKLPSAPVIVLAACRAATTVPYEHKRWSLPDAFLQAGARAVIAPTVEIPDDQAAAFFAELRAELTAGKDPATALAALRAAYVRAGATWAHNVVLFQ